MNNNEYNNIEQKADVPYFTRSLSEGNKLRISRRLIRAQNVYTYRKKISEIYVSEKNLRTEKLNNVIKDAVKMIK